MAIGFEYLVLRNPPVEGIEDQLNALGAVGWELVTVVFYPPDQRLFYFKRSTAGPPPG